MKRSAGLLMYRRLVSGLEVLLAHPGGPYWRSKDAGAWTIPKGEYVAPEQPLAAALREWAEETGFAAEGPFLELGEVALKSGKRICAWAFEGDCDPTAVRCNTFAVEWPPRSGRIRDFPELDRAAWFDTSEARLRIHPAQAAFLDRLTALLADDQAAS
jgi:predicted NUDIX family NTP pyrophosphohydrolase